MNIRMTWKKICGIMLTLALMVPCLVMPAYAADGPYTVSGEYKPNGVTLPDETEFELFAVGGFDRKADDPAISILKLDDAIKEAGYTGNISLGYKKSETGEESKWDDQDWLNDAKTLSDFLVDKKDKFEYKTVTTSGGEFSFSGLGNGLYLLRSDDKQKVRKGGSSDNDFTYYSPIPMYIQVLNGNVTGISVKSIEENAKDFRVTKIWENDSDKTALRPSEIKVEILYGDKVVETQTLNEENKWSYFWEADKDHLEKQWIVREVMDESTAENYYCTTSSTPDEANHLKLIKLTNTYSRYDLEIVKKTDKLAKLSDGSNITAVFEIVGTRGGKEVFKTSAGAVIDETTKTLTVKNIPRNLDSLKVTEVYAGGNYTASPSGAQEATFVAATVADEGDEQEAGETAETGDQANGYYSVTFSNTLGDPTVISHGIVNKYKKTENGVKIVDRIGSQTE